MIAQRGMRLTGCAVQHGQGNQPDLRRFGLDMGHGLTMRLHQAVTMFGKGQQQQFRPRVALQGGPGQL